MFAGNVQGVVVHIAKCSCASVLRSLPFARAACSRGVMPSSGTGIATYTEVDFMSVYSSSASASAVREVGE